MLLLDAFGELLKIDGSTFSVHFSHLLKEYTEVPVHLANIVGLVMDSVW